MILLLAALLGLLQAATEFLPVSSSGHLLVARDLVDFGVADGLAFDVALHVGTLVAILVYFRRDMADLVRGVVGLLAPARASASSRRLARNVVVACIPAGVVGWFLDDVIEAYARHPGVVVVTLVAGAIVFFAAERWWRGDSRMEGLETRDALVVGLAQVLALVPGVSRSGITIAAGMARGLRRDEAARFSFVMATPLLAGAGLKTGLDLAAAPPNPDERAAFAVGAVVSALAGWLVIRFLLGFLRRRSLSAFAWYRLALAAVLAVWIWR